MIYFVLNNIKVSSFLRIDHYTPEFIASWHMDRWVLVIEPIFLDSCKRVRTLSARLKHHNIVVLFIDSLTRLRGISRNIFEGNFVPLFFCL